MTMTTRAQSQWDNVGRPSLAQKEFDNSILRMGRSLIKAAEANPVDGTTSIPKITLRLTRLNPMANDDGSATDPRIAQTADLLRDMGVDVELGERVNLTSELLALTADRPAASGIHTNAQHQPRPLCTHCTHIRPHSCPTATHDRGSKQALCATARVPRVEAAPAGAGRQGAEWRRYRS